MRHEHKNRKVRKGKKKQFSHFGEKWGRKEGGKAQERANRTYTSSSCREKPDV